MGHVALQAAKTQLARLQSHASEKPVATPVRNAAKAACQGSPYRCMWLLLCGLILRNLLQAPDISVDPDKSEKDACV